MIPSAVESAEAPESIEKMPNLAINADDQNWPPLPAGVVVEGKDYYTTCVECIFGVTDIDSAIEDLTPCATTPLTTSWWTVVRSASSIPILIRSSRAPPSKIQTLSAEREPCPRALFLAFGGAKWYTCIKKRRKTARAVFCFAVQSKNERYFALRAGGIGMKRLLCAYRNASLRVKLSLLVTAVLLTGPIACQVALYFYVAENVERQARSAADVTLTQAQTYMDAKLRNVVERLFYIRLDPQL